MSTAAALHGEPRTATRRRRRPTTVALLVAGAVALAWTSGIHLQLWSVGYRHIPTIGPLFLMQGVLSSVLSLVVLAVAILTAAGVALGTPRRAVLVTAGMCAGCAVFLLATMGGFALSDWVGLFGLHDHLDSAYAGLSLVVEAVGPAVFLAAVAESGAASQLRHR